MPSLNITVDTAEAVSFAAAPTIAFGLRVTNKFPEQQIHSVLLRCQIMIEASRRKYNAAEGSGLRDLFGDSDRWGQTLRPLLWTHVSSQVGSFTGSTMGQLHVPCTFDFNVGATKYFNSLENGEVPLCFQFSGTTFYDDAGTLQVDPISWDQESRFRLPVRVWRKMMDEYYPNGAWLRLDREVFDRLYAFKSEHSLMTWEQAIDKLLEASASSPLARKAAK